MWGYRWIFAFFPAQVFIGAVSVALGLFLGGALWGSILGFFSVLVATSLWFGLGLLSTRVIEKFWDAKRDGLLERSWSRAFDEVGLPPVGAPQFFISAEPAPIFLLWSEGRGRRSVIVSRSWLSARSELEIREAFRRASEFFGDGGLRWKTANAWFVAGLVRRLPEGVRSVLWQEKGGTSSSVLQWVISLPAVAWLLWVQRILATDSARRALSPFSPSISAALPCDAARRAAVALMSVEPADRKKTILSFHPSN